jgi:hypothetical protein
LLMVTRSESNCASISTGAQSGGYGGLTADAKRVILRNGSTVGIRPLAAGDEAPIARWFAGLSAQTRYARFFGFLEQLDRRTESALARVDHFNHEAIAALAADGTTVGIARYLRTPRRGRGCGGRRLAGSGIARVLLERIATGARSVGIEPFIVMCLATNNTVVRLLSRRGPTAVGPSDAGLVDVRIDLTSTRPDRARGRRAANGRD